MIPRVVHRIWLDEPVPDRFEAYWQRFKELNPGWAFETWQRSEDLEWLVNRDVFDWQTTHAGRSDVLRYEIIARFGGIYVDTDVEPLRSFEPLIRPEPFAGWENERQLCPTVIGSPAGHPAAVDLVQNLRHYAVKRRRRPPNVQTGPWYLTRRWSKRDDVLLYAPVRFYPVGWWERDKLGGPYPEASFAVHHWTAGWLEDGPGSAVKYDDGPRASARGDKRGTTVSR